jgi:hypothetical protein
MDHTLAALDAQFDTLDAHAEAVADLEALHAPEGAGMPELQPLVRETAMAPPSLIPAPLPRDAEDMDGVIFAALVSPYM